MVQADPAPTNAKLQPRGNRAKRSPSKTYQRIRTVAPLCSSSVDPLRGSTSVVQFFFLSSEWIEELLQG